MVRWGIVGAGRVADQMAAAINASQTLVGVVGRNPDRAQAFAEKHQTTTFDSISTLAGEVDVVYIASPNAFHLEHVTAAAEQKAHVLCEKPLANTVDDARRIVAVCAHNDVQLGMSVQYRQHQAHRNMRFLIAHGDIGTPVFADAAVHLPKMETPSWYQDQSIASGGVIPMSGVHRLDLLRYVLDDEVTAVLAVERSRLKGSVYEDTVACILEFARGTIATVRFAMEASSEGEGISVNGDRGWLRAERTTSSWWSSQSAALKGQTLDGAVDEEHPLTNLYQSQVIEFSQSVQTGTKFSSSGLDGVRAAEITEAINRSAAQERRILIGRK